MSEHQPTLQRLRITYRKGEALKYVGHLDFVRAWERSLRRARVPLAYSESFNPQPRLQFAAALPLGATGRAELMDVWLTQPMEPTQFVALVQPHLPAGLEIVAAAEVPLKAKGLQSLLRAGCWQVDVESDLDANALAGRVADFLAATSVPASRQRKGQAVAVDLRPLVLELAYAGQPQPGWHRLLMTLASHEAATARPEQVLAVLGLQGATARAERLQCLFAEEVAPSSPAAAAAPA
ncbi:MAG: TIGR03936 family radical SAM-associated protein [Caldilineales bacterium]|nr:TIGR03936 family radical SAM-associated protein [Caldilineales bacterium]